MKKQTSQFWKNENLEKRKVQKSLYEFRIILLKKKKKNTKYTIFC